MPPTAFGKYEIRGVLGKGAAATVYDAVDPLTASRVAIKTVALPAGEGPDGDGARARFRQQAQAAVTLSHPNILPVLDYGETDGIAYIVMPFAGGGSLQKRMAGRGQVPLPEIRRVMEQVLAGLQFSHDRGIVHGDVRPANVMLGDDLTVKIADFGIARTEGSGSAGPGPQAYGAPEQWRGDRPVDARSDIYGAGAMLYHMLTGRRAFEGRGQAAILRKVLDGSFDPPSAVLPSVAPALDAVVLKAMATAPGDRFESAAAFAVALKRALAVPRGTPHEPGPVRAAALNGGGKRAVTGAGVAVLLLGAAAGWLLLRPPPAPLPAPVSVPAPAPEAVAAPVPAPAPVVAAPVPAPPVVPAAAAPTLREALAAVPCAAVYGDASPGRLALRGIVPADEYDAVRASFDRTAAETRSWDVLAVPMTDFYCQVIDAVRPVLRGPGEQAGVTARLLPSAVTQSRAMVDGDAIDFEVTGPDAPSLLQVDYVDSSGRVSHYMPRNAEPPLPARRLRANERVRLFDTVPGPAFQVAPPPGTDLVVILASSEPLKMSRTRDDDEDVADYIRALRAAVEAARQKGARITVELVPVEALRTPPKQ